MGELAEATGGVLLRGDPSTPVRAYGIDTRQELVGGAFFALPGSRTDGHAFLADAVRAGAVAAVVTRETSGRAPDALIRVDDAAAALGRAGAYARRRIRGKVVGLTGSAGKTTTKELIAAGLAGSGFTVHRTTANLNNELGVPLTLLACPDDATAAVVEMGMNGPGQIAFLARLADPDAGLVTNVRPAHLEYFDSIEGIAAAKGELYAVLRPDAVSIVNLDDPLVRVQAARHAGPRVTFGRSPQADFRAEEILDRFLPGATLVFRHREARHTLALRLSGAHAAWNALAALAAVAAVGGDPVAAADAMSRVDAAAGRGRVLSLPRGLTVVDDTYNSNPAALASVLETLRQTPVPGRKVLVMGDMLELGPQGPSFHRAAGQQAAEAGVQLFIGVGPLSRAAVDAAHRSGVPQAYHVEDSARAASSVPEWIRESDFVVVKGSRGIRLERVVEAISGLTRVGEA